jgi:hypothetical protein
MVDIGLLYIAVTGALLLVALGVGIRVLRDIFGEARERRRKRRSGELERYTKDEEYDRVHRDPTESADADEDGAASTPCPHCGADNDAAFDYCRRCASPLRPGG